MTDPTDNYIIDGMDILFTSLTGHNVETAAKGTLTGSMIINLLVNFTAAAYVRLSEHGQVNEKHTAESLEKMLAHIKECVAEYGKLNEKTASS